MACCTTVFFFLPSCGRLREMLYQVAMASLVLDAVFQSIRLQFVLYLLKNVTGIRRFDFA